MKFFQDCKTLDDVKTLYRKLAHKYHPDHGGDMIIMQELSTEYAYATAKLIKDGNLSAEDSDKEMRFSEEYRKIIEQIIHLPGIVIELVGLWIWVTGKTKPVHKELSAAKLFYASKKKAWYYRSDHLKAKLGSKKSLDEIRNKYGSEVVKNKDRYKSLPAF